MKIAYLGVKRFKSLHNITHSFDDINMLFGYNNTGKSNFLRFIHAVFMKKPIYQTIGYTEEKENKIQSKTQIQEYNSDFWDGDIIMPYLFNNDERSKNVEFEFLFKFEKNEMPHYDELVKAGYINSTPNQLIPLNLKGIIISKNKILSMVEIREVKINNKFVFDYNNQNKYFLDREKYEDILRALNDCALFLDSDRFLINEADGKNDSYLTSKNLKNWLFKIYLHDYNKFLSFTKFLSHLTIKNDGNKLLKDNLRSYPFEKADIGFTKFEEQLEVMFKNPINGRFPISDYGTGVQQILYLMAKLFETKSSILLIEELELNLSPKYQLDVITFLKNIVTSSASIPKIDQVFFTTHSPYFHKKTDILSLFEVTINQSGYSQISKAKKNRINGYFKKNY